MGGKRKAKKHVVSKPKSTAAKELWKELKLEKDEDTKEAKEEWEKENGGKKKKKGSKKKKEREYTEPDSTAPYIHIMGKGLDIEGLLDEDILGAAATEEPYSEAKERRKIWLRNRKRMSKEVEKFLKLFLRHGDDKSIDPCEQLEGKERRECQDRQKSLAISFMKEYLTKANESDGSPGSVLKINKALKAIIQRQKHNLDPSFIRNFLVMSIGEQEQFQSHYVQADYIYPSIALAKFIQEQSLDFALEIEVELEEESTEDKIPDVEVKDSDVTKEIESIELNELFGEVEEEKEPKLYRELEEEGEGEEEEGGGTSLMEEGEGDEEDEEEAPELSDEKVVYEMTEDEKKKLLTVDELEKQRVLDEEIINAFKKKEHIKGNKRPSTIGLRNPFIRDPNKRMKRKKALSNRLKKDLIKLPDSAKIPKYIPDHIRECITYQQKKPWLRHLFKGPIQNLVAPADVSQVGKYQKFFSNVWGYDAQLYIGGNGEDVGGNWYIPSSLFWVSVCNNKTNVNGKIKCLAKDDVYVLTDGTNSYEFMCAVLEQGSNLVLNSDEWKGTMNVDSLGNGKENYISKHNPRAHIVHYVSTLPLTNEHYLKECEWWQSKFATKEMLMAQFKESIINISPVKDRVRTAVISSINDVIRRILITEGLISNTKRKEKETEAGIKVETVGNDVNFFPESTKIENAVFEFAKNKTIYEYLYEVFSVLIFADPANDIGQYARQYKLRFVNFGKYYPDLWRLILMTDAEKFPELFLSRNINGEKSNIFHRYVQTMINYHIDEVIALVLTNIDPSRKIITTPYPDTSNLEYYVYKDIFNIEDKSVLKDQWCKDTDAKDADILTYVSPTGSIICLSIEEVYGLLEQLHRGERIMKNGVDITAFITQQENIIPSRDQYEGAADMGSLQKDLERKVEEVIRGEKKSAQEEDMTRVEKKSWADLAAQEEKDMTVEEKMTRMNEKFKEKGIPLWEEEKIEDKSKFVNCAHCKAMIESESGITSAHVAKGGRPEMLWYCDVRCMDTAAVKEQSMSAEQIKDVQEGSERIKVIAPQPLVGVEGDGGEKYIITVRQPEELHPSVARSMEKKGARNLLSGERHKHRAIEKRHVETHNIEGHKRAIDARLKNKRVIDKVRIIRQVLSNEYKWGLSSDQSIKLKALLKGYHKQFFKDLTAREKDELAGMQKEVERSSLNERERRRKNALRMESKLMKSLGIEGTEDFSESEDEEKDIFEAAEKKKERGKKKEEKGKSVRQIEEDIFGGGEDEIEERIERKIKRKTKVRDFESSKEFLNFRLEDQEPSEQLRIIAYELNIESKWNLSPSESDDYRTLLKSYEKAYYKSFVEDYLDGVKEEISGQLSDINNLTKDDKKFLTQVKEAELEKLDGLPFSDYVASNLANVIKTYFTTLSGSEQKIRIIRTNKEKEKGKGKEKEFVMTDDDYDTIRSGDKYEIEELAKKIAKTYIHNKKAASSFLSFMTNINMDAERKVEFVNDLIGSLTR